MDRRAMILAVCFLLLAIAAGCSSPEAPSIVLIGDHTADASPSLLLRATTDGQGQQLRPVDPVSLADLPGYAPIDFNRHYRQVASRDGRKLAVMLHPDNSPGNPGWQLRVIDLASWTDSLDDLDIDQMVTGLTFSPDGRALYWAKPYRRDSAHGVATDYELYRYDLTSGELMTVVRLPSSFLLWEMRMMRSGRHLAAFGSHVNYMDLSEVNPHVVIVDLSTGRITADVRLDGVKAGQIRVEPATVILRPCTF